MLMLNKTIMTHLHKNISRVLGVQPVIILLLMLFSLISCKKDWLDAKTNKSQDIPTTVEDFQAILDNTGVMNNRAPFLTEISADDFYLTPASPSALIKYNSSVAMPPKRNAAPV